MNLHQVEVEYAHMQFKTTCIRCHRVMDTRFDKVHADRNGCPFRSYYCDICARVVQPFEANSLAVAARRMVHLEC